VRYIWATFCVIALVLFSRDISYVREFMATIFWDSEGVMQCNYREHGNTITVTYYADLI